MSTEIIDNGRVSFWQRACLLGLIAVYVAMGLLRLNDCELFNPDSPRYVIYSQSIVNLGDYRATDLPGSPLYSWRPPGLSLMIAPVMAIWPYNVVAAKVAILLCGVALLCTVFQLSLLHSGAWAAVIVTGAVASNPTFLVMSTEVLSEIPYTLGVLVVLLLLSRSTIRPSDAAEGHSRLSRFRVFAITVAALTYIPWLRTAGVALVAAVGIWSVMSRSRFRWLTAVVAAISGLGLLALRNKQAAGENYVGSMLNRLREQGPGAMISSGLETIAHYLSSTPALLLPGLTSQRASYAPLTLEALPSLGLPHSVHSLLAAFLCLLALLGMWKRRSYGGSLALLYVCVYCACLVIWPWRHERFVWPLIPVMLAYVPAGLSSLTQKFPSNGRSLASYAAMSLIWLCCWQTLVCGQLVRVNLEFLRDRIAFHATRCPGFYYSNWRQAGVWLNAHAPEFSRVLTWHAAVAETSFRFQKRVQFETLPPDKLRQQIERFAARYLVVPDAQFGDGFGWQQLEADSGVKLKVVYREQDVAVLEVVPNRTGEISKTAYPEWLERQLQLIKEARTRLPNRTDLVIRQAGLLREAGHDGEAIQILRKLVTDGVMTTRVCAELGWLLYDAGEFAEAAKFLDIARTLPNAESIASLLADGAARARERMREKDSGQVSRSMDRQLNRVKSLMGNLKYAAAEREAERLIAGNPDHPEANFVRGKIHHRLGELDKADECYDRALKLGFADAQEWLFLIRFSAALASQQESTVEAGSLHQIVDPADPAAHLRLAGLFNDHGWPGRSLATLEAANQQFPNLSMIQKPLADKYVAFAFPELAIPLYELVLKANPDDDTAKKEIQVAESLLVEPQLGDRVHRAGKLASTKSRAQLLSDD